MLAYLLVRRSLVQGGDSMDIKGLEYAIGMTNQLSETISIEKWDEPLMKDIGTLRKLFVHLVRVRNIYRDGLETGVLAFPGVRPQKSVDLKNELHISKEQLIKAFLSTKCTTVAFHDEILTVEEVYSMAIQHEGIHQGQFAVALQNKGIELPPTWKKDWNL